MDYIIINLSNCNRVTYTNVLPRPSINDHDGPYGYVTINVPETPYAPRYKMLRHEQNYDEAVFFKSFSTLPFKIVYVCKDSELNNLVNDCLEIHASLIYEWSQYTSPSAMLFSKTV